MLQAASPGYVRSFGVGSAFAVGWTPCVGPVLAAILGLASTQGGVAEATVLLAVYTVGFSIPFLASGAFFGASRRVFQRVMPYLDQISFVSGALIIVVGILIFTDSLINLNSLFSFAEVDQVDGRATLGLVGLIVAFVAGIVSVVSPCVLPMVPVYMLYVTGSSVSADGELESVRSPFLHALAFVLGFGVIFIVLGASVGLIGTFLRDDIFTRAAGALLIVLGLQLAGVINIPFLQVQRRAV
jgi:cytochrome c biogenesis protein CcdA